MNEVSKKFNPAAAGLISGIRSLNYFNAYIRSEASKVYYVPEA